MRTALFVVALLCLPHQVQAEEPLWVPLTIYFSGAAADLTATHKFLQYEGIYEANPLGTWLSDQPTALVVTSALFDAGVVYTLHKVWGKRHPKLERVILYGAAAVRWHLAQDNFRLLGRLEQEGYPRRR